jgi:hypothetical protein
VSTTITDVKPSYGKAADAITVVGTGFTDTPSESVILVRKHGTTPWTVVDPSRVAYVSATQMTLTLHAAEFPSGGIYDIGVADNGETAPDAYLRQALFFYVAGVYNPDAVIKGAPEAIYIDGRFMGHAHGALEIDHEVKTSDIEVNESLLPVRTIKVGETYSLKVPLAEVTLENLKDVWGVSAQITDEGTGRRRLTFGGDTAVTEQPVMVILPAGSGKKWALTFYRCAIVAPGTLSWNRDDQVDLPLQITVLADTSRAVGDQVGRVEEYTAA